MASIPCKVSPALMSLLVISVLVYFAVAADNKTNQPCNNVVSKKFVRSEKMEYNFRGK